MGEVAPGKRHGGYPAHEDKSLCILRHRIVCKKNASIPAIKLRMGRQIDVVQWHTAKQRIGWTRWGTRTVRVENIPRTHLTADPPRDPKVDGRIGSVHQKSSLEELIIFMSMFNDIIWGNKVNEFTCLKNSAL